MHLAPFKVGEGDSMLYTTINFVLILGLVNPGLVVQEPILPLVHSASLVVRCKSETLEIGNYGHAVPRNRMPIIISNGQALEGKEANALKEDLADDSAVYRLAARCHREESGIWLQIYSGKQSGAGIDYKVGSMVIVNGKIERYNKLGPSTAETFWFR